MVCTLPLTTLTPPAPVTAPEKVEVTPPPNVKLPVPNATVPPAAPPPEIDLSVVLLLFRSSVAPATFAITTGVAVETLPAPAGARRKVPPLTVVGPVYVFAAPST